MQTALPLSDGLFRTVIDAAPVAMAILHDGRCIHANAAFAALHECAGKQKCRHACSIEELLSGGDITRDALANKVSAGQEVTGHSQIRGCKGTFEEVSYVLKHFQQQDEDWVLLTVREHGREVRMRRLVDHLAFHDSLTELPNRALLFDRLSQALARMRRENWGFALVILDLDGFKEVNDVHGHGVGDELLYAVGRRLLACVRASDTVARLGGDEFALLLHGLRSEAEASQVARKILSAFVPPFDLGSTQASLGASIGIALCPTHGLSLDALLTRADRAMYRSKQDGKNRYTLSDGCDSDEAIPVRMPWVSPIVLGHDGLDDQHARLIEAANDIIEAMADGRASFALSDRLADFEQLASYHFAYEEALMERCGLPEPNRIHHIAAHHHLLSELPALSTQIMAGAFTTSVQYLRKWLMDHLRGEDRDLVTYLRQHQQ